MSRTRRWPLLLCFLGGCSTHPCADISDFFHPGKMYPNEVTPYGGVWVQQHPISPLTPVTPILPAIVPPPAPLPGAPNVQLQPPQIPPPPPPPPPGMGGR